MLNKIMTSRGRIIGYDKYKEGEIKVSISAKAERSFSRTSQGRSLREVMFK